ncbi:MAG TPA: hypothetical protein VFV71_10060 [Burkholderiales bacterium]|nr:hypothetical protein [Burkholderiales bacterium]
MFRPRKPIASRAAAVAALLWLGIATAGAESTRFGLDAEYLHDTNVNRAALDKEEQADDAVSLQGYAARSILLTGNSGLVLRAALRGTEYFEFGDLSNLAASARVAWRMQPSPGFTSPWLELYGEAEAFRFRDSDLRDGYLWSAGASVGKYFTDRIRAEIGAGYDSRGGGAGGVYDVANAKAWLALDYRIASAVTVYGSGTWMDGDQVFTLYNTAKWGSYYWGAKASAPDPVFASAFGGSPMAYRVGARTDRYELGLNVALAGNHALDFGWSHFEARADSGGGRYDGDTFRAGYLYRFR